MIDPLLWLENQTLYPKVYWETRGEKRIFAAAGQTACFDRNPVGVEGRYFGGISFCEKTWDHFPKCYFFLPQIEMEQTPSAMRLSGQSNLELRSFSPFSEPISRKDSLAPIVWEAEISKYLEMIENNRLQKIVCGRRTTLGFAQVFCPLSLLHELKKVAHNTTFFVFQMNPQCAFIGATPEKLYHRKGNEIVCDVLAGTKTKKSDLLASPKERLEFNYVKDFIAHALAPLCDNLTIAEDTIASTAHLEHFFTQISGKLKSGVTDADLIRSLHPTPAMGGIPRETALSLLSQNESFTRGWYAAPIGWISPEEADIGVGIRSALMQEKELHLFSAAGIVKGSDPKSEWEELEQKIAPFKSIFV